MLMSGSLDDELLKMITSYTPGIGREDQKFVVENDNKQPSLLYDTTTKTLAHSLRKHVTDIYRVHKRSVSN